MLDRSLEFPNRGDFGWEIRYIGSFGEYFGGERGGGVHCVLNICARSAGKNRRLAETTTHVQCIGRGHRGCGGWGIGGLGNWGKGIGDDGGWGVGNGGSEERWRCDSANGTVRSLGLYGAPGLFL